VADALVVVGLGVDLAPERAEPLAARLAPAPAGLRVRVAPGLATLAFGRDDARFAGGLPPPDPGGLPDDEDDLGAGILLPPAVLDGRFEPIRKAFPTARLPSEDEFE
jgi:hypothetical protein